ncbi:MAG: DUF2793 domain-containing protein [Rhizobiaceae bacterium]
MSEQTLNLALPYILSSQAQKHVTHNEALRMLDTFIQLSVISKGLSAPPPEPGDGDRYIVADPATGDWSGQDGSVAAFQDGTWAFYTPKPGWRAWLQDKTRLEIFNGSNWQEPAAIIPECAFTRLQTIDEELALPDGGGGGGGGDGTSVTANTQIPTRSIVLGVSVRVSQAIADATSFDVGVSGETGKFGSNLGINVGDTNIGVIGPTAFYDQTPIVITANGANFTGGKIILALHYVECGPPTI